MNCATGRRANSRPGIAKVGPNPGQRGYNLAMAVETGILAVAAPV